MVHQPSFNPQSAENFECSANTWNLSVPTVIVYSIKDFPLCQSLSTISYSASYGGWHLTPRERRDDCATRLVLSTVYVADGNAWRKRKVSWRRRGNIAISSLDTRTAVT